MKPDQDLSSEIAMVWEQTYRVLKYSREISANEAALHKTLVKAKDFLPHLIYADWLEEHNRPATSKAIRKWVEYQEKERNPYFKGNVQYRVTSKDHPISKLQDHVIETADGPKKFVELTLPHGKPDEDYMILHPDTEHRVFYPIKLPVNEAEQLHQELIEEYNQNG